MVSQRKGEHVIADLSFSMGWVLCACGVRLKHVDPDRLVSLFNEHRKAMGLKVG